MRQVKNYPHSPTALDYFKSAISKNKILLKTDSSFIFVCGAKPNSEEPNARDRLIEYAQKHIKYAHFFIAEKFFEVFTNKNKKDLLSLEDKLAEYSDCIIILLESESTFAELGAFAIKSELAKIMLAVNDIKYQNSATPSFITLGPLAKLNKSSKFKPVIYSNLQSILTIIPVLEKRLEQIERKYRISYNVQNYSGWKNLSPKIRMFLLHDIILLFNPITISELVSLLVFLWGQNNYEIHMEVAMLKALNMIKESDEYLLHNPTSINLYFDYPGINILKLKSYIINHFHKYSKVRKKIILNRIYA